MSSLSSKNVSKLHTLSSIQESTTSSTEGSLVANTIPGGLISEDGQLMHIRYSGYAETADGDAVLKFGATTLATVAVATGKAFCIEASVLRIDENNQVATVRVNNDGTVTCTRASPAEDLSGDVTVDFRGAADASGTFYLNEAALEIF